MKAATFRSISTATAADNCSASKTTRMMSRWAMSVGSTGHTGRAENHPAGQDTGEQRTVTTIPRPLSDTRPARTQCACADACEDGIHGARGSLLRPSRM